MSNNKRKNFSLDNNGTKITPSRSAQKRESLALQKLGAELAILSPEQLAKLDLPAELIEAIELFQRITNNEGRRRQLQYIGRLMREIEPEPIRKALAEVRDIRAKDVLLFQQTEEWRNKFLSCAPNEIIPLAQELYEQIDSTSESKITLEEEFLEMVHKARLQPQNANRKKNGPNYLRELFGMISDILGRDKK